MLWSCFASSQSLFFLCSNFYHFFVFFVELVVASVCFSLLLCPYTHSIYLSIHPTVIIHPSVHTSLCLYIIHSSIHPSVDLSIHPSSFIQLSAHPPLHPSAHISVCISIIHLSVGLSIFLITLSIRLFHLSICPFTLDLSNHLSIHLSSIHWAIHTPVPSVHPSICLSSSEPVSVVIGREAGYILQRSRGCLGAIHYLTNIYYNVTKEGQYFALVKCSRGKN